MNSDPIRSVLQEFFAYCLTHDGFKSALTFNKNHEDLEPHTTTKYWRNIEELFVNCYKPHLKYLSSLNTACQPDDHCKLIKILRKDALLGFLVMVNVRPTSNALQIFAQDLDGFLSASCIGANLEIDQYENLRIIMPVKDVAYKLINGVLGENNEPVQQRYHIKIGIGEFTPNVGLEMTIKDYRRFLLARFLSRLFEKQGYSVDGSQFNRLPIYHQNEMFIIREDVENSKERVVLRTSIGECHHDLSSIQSLYKKRLGQMRKIGEERAADPSSETWSTSLSQLVYSWIHLELLSKSPNMIIQLGNSSSLKDNPFIQPQYNYARISSILKRFEKGVVQNEYPELPPLDKVISDLKEIKKEEIDLIDILLEWPCVQVSVVDFINLQTTLSIFQNFIKQLTHRFKEFYSKSIVIVASNQHHLFNQMFWRIYLLKSVGKVYKECFELVNVN